MYDSFFKNGSGQALILIHGFCESKEMWKTFPITYPHPIRSFVPISRVCESPINHRQISLRRQRSYYEWMGENKILNPIIIGHSLGGYVTWLLAELMGHELKVNDFSTPLLLRMMREKAYKKQTMILSKNWCG